MNITDIFFVLNLVASIASFFWLYCQFSSQFKKLNSKIKKLETKNDEFDERCKQTIDNYKTAENRRKGEQIKFFDDFLWSLDFKSKYIRKDLEECVDKKISECEKLFTNSETLKIKK